MRLESGRPALFFIGLVLLSGLVLADAAPKPYTAEFSIPKALVLTLIVEVIVAAGFLALIKKMRIVEILRWVALANIISVPLLWISMALLMGANPGAQFIYRIDILSYLILLSMLEWGVFLFEAVFVWGFSKKGLRFDEVLALSAVINAASVLVGLVVL